MVVVWRITEACNLACPFCAYDRRLNRSRSQAVATDVRRGLRLWADYRRETEEGVLISWLGGEPLHWAPLAELSREACALGLRVSATTNGTALVRAETRSWVRECLAELTISVDAPDQRHDHLRGWVGGWDQLTRAVTALAAEKRATGEGPRLRVNALLQHDTWADFPLLCERVADWGVEEITFNQLGGNDRPEYFPAHRLHPSDVDAFAAGLPGLRERLAERGVALSGGEGYVRRLRASSRGERLAVDDCHPGEGFCFIDERGRIAPCHFTGDTYGIPLEGLKSAKDLRALSRRFADSRRRVRAAACEDCHSTQVCEKFAQPIPCEN